MNFFMRHRKTVQLNSQPVHVECQLEMFSLFFFYCFILFRFFIFLVIIIIIIIMACFEWALKSLMFVYLCMY